MIAWIILVISTLFVIRIAKNIHFKHTKYDLYAWAVLSVLPSHGTSTMGGLGPRGWMRDDRICDHVSDIVGGLSNILIWKAIGILEQKEMVESVRSPIPGYYDYRATEIGGKERRRLSRIVPEGRKKLRECGA